ncbi:MAG: AAC(3) family N-acetyltransferase [Candidatus Omnitrophica bacterium]|nr:AAC(3) family N-acetyltransferase [Candidatus Omnitrophota bacterium]
MKITKSEIKKGLKEVGLKKGDLVLVHSALSSLGAVDNGPQAVIDALIKTVGPKGTVAMTRLGGALTTKTFAERKDTIESIHPTHPVAAWGRRAKELIHGHIAAPTACGKGTPFGRLIDWQGYILLLGVDQDRNTTLHAIEEFADSPYLSEIRVKYKDADGREKEKTLQKFPGPHRNFIGMDRLFRETGVMRTGKIGNAVVRLMQAQKMAQVSLKVLKDNPAAFLCDNPNCADCVMQRGKVKEKILRAESFVLTAANTEISADLRQALTIMQGQGIRQVELGRFKGKDLCDCAVSEHNQIKEDLAGSNFTVAAINTGLNHIKITGNLKENLTRYKEFLQLAKFFKTNYLVISSFYPALEKKDVYRNKALKNISEMTTLAEEAGIVLLIENEPGTFCAGSRDCLDIIRSVNSPYLRLAFNPGNFARLGEKPFLGIPSRIRKFASLLYINDALPSGPFQLPGQGNGEIKELISILRCRSFNGFFSLKPGLGQGRENFNQAADAFWRLLKTM